MKKYNYFGRVSGWGICMLFFLTGLFTGCSENEEDYPKGQRPAGIDYLYCRGRQSRENPRKPEHHQSPCGKKRKTGDSRISAGDLEELEVIVIAFYKLSDFTILYRRK